MRPYFLTADIGTTSLKSACIDSRGKLLSYSRVLIDKYKPASAEKLSANQWLLAFAESVMELCAQHKKFSPEAVCVSGNGPTLVPIDSNEMVIGLLHWKDKNFLPSPPDSQSFFLPRAAWYKKEFPESYNLCRYFFSSHEWLLYKLGSDPVTSLPSSEYEKYYWDKRQCDIFNLDIEKFPPFVKMGTITGRISNEAALEFGLPSGIPLISGAPDFISAIIGTGVLEPGMVCDRAGSSEGFNYCALSDSISPDILRVNDLRVLPHYKEGLINVSTLVQSGHLYGYDHNTEIWGKMISSAINKLTVSGLPVNKMIVSGGQGKIAKYNQLKANMTGVTLAIPEITDAELTGNAVLAACALGMVPDVKKGAKKMVRIKEIFYPNKLKT